MEITRRREKQRNNPEMKDAGRHLFGLQLCCQFVRLSACLPACLPARIIERVCDFSRALEAMAKCDLVDREAKRSHPKLGNQGYVTSFPQHKRGRRQPEALRLLLNLPHVQGCQNSLPELMDFYTCWETELVTNKK